MSSEQRRDELRDELETLIGKFTDVLVADDGDLEMHMPILGHWVLITTHDDMQDPTLLAGYRIAKKHQATHETAGLLYLNLEELRRPSENE